MILITGTNNSQINTLRRELLHVGLISEKTTLSALCSRLALCPYAFAVLHIVEKHRPALENVILLAKHLYPHAVHGVLYLDDCDGANFCAKSFDFVLPLSVSLISTQ